MILAKSSKIEGYRLYWEQIHRPESCGCQIILHKSKSVAQASADLKNGYEKTISIKNRINYWIDPVYAELEEI